MPDLDLVATCVVELPPGEAPEWVQLIPAGEFSARDGRRWRLDDADKVIAATRRHQAGVDMVFDYEHQTILTQQNGREAPASGWIKKLQARTDGIWARVEWTAHAKRRIEAREYRYVSPVFQYARADGAVKVLQSAALTNDPALDLPALARRNVDDDDPAGGSMHEQLKRILAKLGLKEDSEPTKAEADAALARIDPDPPIDLAALATALGLKATATAAEALAAAKARGGELATALGLAATATGAEVLAAAKAAKASAATDDPDPTAFVPRAEFDRVATRLNALETTRADEQATAAVDDAIKAGKLAPAQRDWGLAAAKKDLAAFTSYAESAPVIVTPAAPAPATAGDPEAALTSEERAVCRNLGIAEDDFKASRKADIEQAEGVA